MDSNEKRLMYENALMGILQSEGEILPFLDTIFGFLYRCTDFYRIQHTPNEKLGFPPKVAEKLVLTAFRKYEKLVREDEAKKISSKKTPHTVTNAGEIPVAETVEVEAYNKENIVADSSTENKENVHTRIDKPNDKAVDESIEDGGDDDDDDDDEKTDENAKELKRQQKAFQSNSDSYNGAIRDNYSWSQSIKDLDVMVNVPKHITRGKFVKVDIQHTHLTANIIENGEIKSLVDGDLCWRINVEKSYWTLIPGEAIQINLEKIDERWWDALLTDEPKINIRNIDASRPMEELGEDEQAKIQELMFNEQQKRLGKTTTEQQKIENILRDAWNKEGSPFKGQPFDPSLVNISPGDSNILFTQNQHK